MQLKASEMLKSAHDATRLLASMANEKRLMILCQLVDGEKSVGELAEFLNARPSTVSQHLALLRKDGLVAARRDAQTLLYTLAADEPRAVLETLYACYCDAGGKKTSTGGRS